MKIDQRKTASDILLKLTELKNIQINEK